jgi:hypothetical protein
MMTLVIKIIPKNPLGPSLAPLFLSPSGEVSLKKKKKTPKEICYNLLDLLSRHWSLLGTHYHVEASHLFVH